MTTEKPERPKINVYTCPACEYKTVTIDLDEGVTPFMLGCRNPKKCAAMAVSSCYRCDQTLTPAWEWYKPNDAQFKRLSPGMKEHVQKGGLDIRKRSAAVTKQAEQPTPGGAA